MKTDLSRLRELLRDEINTFYDDGGGSPAQVAGRVCEKWPDLIDQLGTSLARQRVTDIARRMMKSWSAAGSAAKEQFVLPGFARHLLADLPAAIWVPDDGDGIYRPLHGPKAASVGEVRAALLALWAQIKADTRKAKALEELVDLCVRIGATDETTVPVALSQYRSAAE